MNIVFLTTDDPIYLPAFYDRVLAAYGAQTREVAIVPPLYKNQTTTRAAWRYYRTFGFEGVRGLVSRIVRAKTRRRSIAAACARHGVACNFVGDVNAPEFLEHLREIGADLLVSVSCPQIFKRDLIDPEVEVDSQGRIHLLDEVGLGFQPNWQRIEEVTVRTEVLRPS